MLLKLTQKELFPEELRCLRKSDEDDISYSEVSLRCLPFRPDLYIGVVGIEFSSVARDGLHMSKQGVFFICPELVS